MHCSMHQNIVLMLYCLLLEVIRFALSFIMAQANVHCIHHFNIKIIISDMEREVPQNAN